MGWVVCIHDGGVAYLWVRGVTSMCYGGDQWGRSRVSMGRTGVSMG